MNSMLKAIALGALLVTPGIAGAVTNCQRNALRGDWRMLSVNPFGATSACDLSINRRGNISGNCYSVEFNDGTPTQYFQPASGRFRLASNCTFSGSLTVGSNPEPITVEVYGRAWASGDTNPMFLTGSGSFNLQGYDLVLGMDMHRMVNGAAPVPTAP
ncbi:MAG: hypothetical protein H6898_14150 [Rhodobacter sp.]|nr:hypothetical protein [Paracoccaceae bacterium]MCC0077700.1 hypothetical protein [Rhodobacter sp.]